jgi:serine/threonine protein kinase
VVHRDLKPSNVLLDRHLSAKVADVGLAYLMPSTPNPRPVLAVEEHSRSYLTQLTDCAGTSGYIDPEYLTTGNLVRVVRSRLCTPLGACLKKPRSHPFLELQAFRRCAPCLTMTEHCRLSLYGLCTELAC